jgi:hypothetical protein
MEFKTLKEQYLDLVIDRITVSKEDLTEVEEQIINIGYELLSEKLDDIKILNDEIKRISLELANLKAYQDDTDYTDWDLSDDDDGDFDN